MKVKPLFLTLFTLVCAASLTACGGGGGGSSSGNSAESSANGDDAGNEENGQPGSLAQLLPEDVASADFIIEGRNGIHLQLKVSQVELVGNVWRAALGGKITLPTEEMGFTSEKPDYESFEVMECTLERSSGTGIILRTTSLSTPALESEVALEIRELHLSFDRQDKEFRSGLVEDGAVWVHYNAGPLSDGLSPMDISNWLDGASVKLHNFTRK